MSTSILALLYFIGIYITMEFLSNRTIFVYMKNYFSPQQSHTEQIRKFLGMEISIFKGALERLIIFFALVQGISQILIVFGAIKIGTRLDKDNPVKNDYFLIGNFTSLLIVIFCFFIFELLTGRRTFL